MTAGGAIIYIKMTKLILVLILGHNNEYTTKFVIVYTAARNSDRIMIILTC